MQAWRAIESAPRDGTLVLLSDSEGMMIEMRWDAEMRNGLFPGAVGFWTTADRGMTWAEDDDFGPEFWKPLLAN